jgi:hypothetical protein
MAGKRIIVFCLFSLVALALAAFASSGTQAGSYKAFHGYALTDTTAADANSDSDNDIGIYVPDYNYEDSSMYTLTPVDMWSEMGFNIPIGAKMGRLDALSTVGVANGACGSAMYPSFKMHNASTDTTDTLDASDMYWLLKDKDAYPVPYDDLPDPPYDDDLPDYLEAYPYFLNQMFDPDGAGPEPPLVPKARYAGHVTNVANMNILVQIVVFHPGQLSLLPGIYSQLGTEMGSPSVVVLNNPISADEAPGAISDFCTPLATTTTLYKFTLASDYGVGGAGIEAQHNPSAGAGVMGTGTIISRNYSRSERDADGDGIENDLDPCHYSDDTGWDPRAAGGAGTGDEDNDGLPDSCDPYPNTYDNDEDDDGYLNKQDICPLKADGEATTNQADDDAGLQNDDLGPGPDSIGNACDDSDGDGSEDGCGAGTCTDGIDNGASCDGSGTDGKDELDSDCDSAWDAVDSTPWGTNPSTGLFYHSMPWAAVCIGGDDDDGDGYCNSLEVALGSPTNNGAETGTQCDDAVDSDFDGYINDGCPVSGKVAETGTECASGNNTNDDSATDIDDNGKVNDGCPVIGVPESLVIDAQIVAGDAQPTNAVPQSCSDGVDNDGDGDTDSTTETQDLGCNPGDDSYASDSDYDSYDDSVDNCPNVWNPEQSNNDGHHKGDACDADDDDDTWSDVDEWKAGSDPLDAASTPEVCDGADNDGDGATDEGYPDTDSDGIADCKDPDIDSDSDGTYNDVDTDCDDANDGAHFNNAKENYMGTDPCVKCAAGGVDNDPYDTNKSGGAINVLDLFTFVSNTALGGNVSDDNALGVYWNRLDTNQNGGINVLDLFAWVSGQVIGKTCGVGY